MAVCLGYFFRKYPDYFKSVDGIVFGNGVDLFRNMMLDHPEDLNNYISVKILPEKIYDAYKDFKWLDEVDGYDEKLDNFVNTIRSIAEEYEKAKKAALNDEKYAEVDYYVGQIEKLHKNRVIDSLSKYCVIPKYGFPVDVVQLQVYDDGKMNNELDLNRDLKIAISEYAPDSEVIVDGKKYTSRYISLPKTGEFARRYFFKCDKCKKVNVYVSERTGDRCKCCGAPIEKIKKEVYIEPVYGFKTGVTKESRKMKPKRSYSGEISYIGGGTKDEGILEIGELLKVETSSNDELLIVNKSSFYMCENCGFSIIDSGNRMPVITKKHKNYYQYDCECDQLKKINLGHKFQTDVARITIPSLEAYDKEDYAQALSFMYALLEGLSIALGIERNDIDGILEYNLEKCSYDILVYDNVSGGAGHVKRLLSKKAINDSLSAAHSKVSQRCCDEDTSCYNCLRNYYNQAHHSKLQRKLAKDFIEYLIREIG